MWQEISLSVFHILYYFAKYYGRFHLNDEKWKYENNNEKKHKSHLLAA